MSATFEVYKSRSLFTKQRWRWRLVASNGEVVTTSEGYSSPYAAKRSIFGMARILSDRSTQIDEGNGMVYPLFSVAGDGIPDSE